MAEYKLSSAATNDVVAIYKFGIKHFGAKPAKAYLQNLELFLKELAIRPLHPRQDHRRFVAELTSGHVAQPSPFAFVHERQRTE